MLLVEDEADARELLKVVIEYAGGLVTAVPSAPAALAALEGLHPDVLVADIILPAHDGYWLLRQVRALGHGRDLPAIAVTGRVRAHERARLFEAGFQAYLAKPVDPLDFCRVIADLAGRA